jgi:hypothetical protein
MSGAVKWRASSCFTGKLVCGNCGSTLTYTPATGTNKDGITEYQMGQYRCSNKRNNGLKACSAKNLPLRALRQACCSSLGPLAGSNGEAEFDPAWIEALVDHIVVHDQSLEFHLKGGGVLPSPWKGTARSDAWVLRREKMSGRNENSSEGVNA